MVQRTRAQRLNGLFPLSYVGVVPVSPINFVMDDRPPTVNDSKNFYIGDLWLDIDSNTPPKIHDLWMLVSLDGGVATWKHFGSGDVESLTGNSGGAVFPDNNGNINTIGDNVGITVVGNPGTNTLTWSLSGGGTAAQSFPTDSGTATPDGLGVLNIITNNATNNAGASTLFTGVGNTVQLNVTDANFNTALGQDAGNLLMSGTNNTAFGYTALEDLDSGVNNTAIGSGALNAITIGDNNTALGNQAGSTNTIGDDNVYIGSLSGQVSTGTGNTLVGSSSGAALTTGDYNTVVGSFAGEALTTAFDNTLVGHSCCNVMTTGDHNTVIGHEAGLAMTNAADNAIMGYRTALDLTTGIGNVIIGPEAGASLVTGDNNIIVGRTSGSLYTGAESRNVLVGSTGVTGDNDVMRLGQTVSRSFMGGVYGVTPALSDTQTVIIDSDGQLGTSGTPSPTAAFMARATETTNITGDGTAAAIVFDLEAYDINNDYDSTTGIFTAPVDGIYNFILNVVIADLTSVAFTSGALNITCSDGQNPGIYLNVYNIRLVGGSNSCALNVTHDLELAAGTTVQGTVTVSGGAKTVGQGYLLPLVRSTFSGRLIQAT